MLQTAQLWSRQACPRVVHLLALLTAAAASESAHAQPCQQWVNLGSSGSFGQDGGHGMTFDPTRSRVVIFGGNYNGPDMTGLIEWTGTNWLHSTPGGPPDDRCDYALWYDQVRGGLLVYGGYYSTQYPTQGGTYELIGSTWSLVPTQNPPARTRPRAAYDSQRRVAVLFGGTDGVQYMSDTWEWNGAAWSAATTVGPSPRDQHSVAYDANRGVVVLFGGRDDTTAFGDTWEWDGVAWMLRSVTGPQPRFGAAMAYHEYRGRTVLFGGSTIGGDLFGDTWEWDGVQWQLTLDTDYPATPRPADQIAMAYDPLRQTMLLKGADLRTWELRSCAVILSISPNQSLEVWDPLTLSISVCGIGPFQYQWRKNGIPLSNDGRVLGATSPNLAISPTRLGDAGSYDVVLTNMCGALQSSAVLVTVDCYPNCDGSALQPILNAADFTCFLQKFALHLSYANCDGSTSSPVLNVADFTCFLQRFGAGCP